MTTETFSDFNRFSMSMMRFGNNGKGAEVAGARAARRARWRLDEAKKALLARLAEGDWIVSLEDMGRVLGVNPKITAQAVKELVNDDKIEIKEKIVHVRPRMYSLK